MALIRRKDRNFFAKITISDQTFIVAQRVQWNFTSVGIALSVESGNPLDAIQYSFDGQNVHGDLTPGQASQGIIFDNRHENKVWFRTVNQNRDVIVRVETWRTEA